MKNIYIYLLSIIISSTGSAFAAPTADAGPNQTVLDREGDGSETVVLESSTSTGNIVGWEWKEGASVLSTDVRCLATFPVGSHTITLTVTNDLAQVDTDTVDITVTALSGPKQRRNLKDAPTSNRFVRPLDLVWPATDGEADICLWKDDAFAAASLSVDDNTVPNHDWWLAQTSLYGWDMTWFVITDQVDNGGSYYGPWSEFQELANAGHNVQSHSVTHASNDDVRPDSEMIVEYRDAISAIEANLTGVTVSTAAWPWGNLNRDVGAMYYTAARGTAGSPNKPERIDYLNAASPSTIMDKDHIDSVMLGTSGTSWLGNDAYKRGWASSFTHYLNTPELLATTASNLAYAASFSDLWVGTFGDVARYGQQRDTATLTMTANTSSLVSFTLSDEMDDSLFDAPLTVKVKMHSGWTDVDATQNGSAIVSEVVSNNGDLYALVQAVPDQGEVVLTSAVAQTTTSITQYGITWAFDQAVPYGQYANGDYWVVGPVNIISLTNEYHSVAMGLDGSEINPAATGTQGYDNRLGNYDAARNKSYPSGSVISGGNPLTLATNSSLLSSVSWVIGEVGAPATNSATGTPRPAIRTTAILTCVSSAPATGSFRPPYCGADKSAQFNVSQLDYSKLSNLTPPAGVTPVLADVEADFSGPWVDHVNSWIGAYIHPDMHMREYGRDLSIEIGQGALMLNLDFSQLPGSPSKETLLVNYTQLGIDLAGIADVGGGWPSDGGHMQGRKWPILSAGTVLNDAHMKDIGNWATDFQEDMDTFYVDQAAIDVTHSGAWNPDDRGDAEWPYETVNIGLPEWGIRHSTAPEQDNLHWTATYRDINVQSYTGWILAAHMMGQSANWNHDPVFDFIDRATSINDTYHPNPGYYIYGNAFIREMWYAYRSTYTPQWVPNDPNDIYGHGVRVGSISANFSASPTSGDASLWVEFSDLSVGVITNRFWDFGDGNTLNTTATTVAHTYTATGTNTVQLIVSGPDGSSTNTLVDYISVTAPPPSSNEIIIPAHIADQQVRGNGTSGTSLNFVGQQNDQLSGAQSGEIVVPFELPNLGGEGITSANLLAAMNSPTWQAWGNVDVYGVRYAASSAVALSDYAPFSDSAGNGTKLMDNFYVSGSGTAVYQDLETDATGDAALAAWLTAQYAAGAKAGDFVFLRFQPDHMDAVNGNAISFATADTVAETTPVLTISTAVISAGPPVASFTGTPTSGTAPLLVTFTDSSTGTISNRFWNFGDGTTTNTTATTVAHTYTAAGTNTVQLIVSGLDGSGTNTQVNLISVVEGLPPVSTVDIDASLADQQVRGNGTAGSTLNWIAQQNDQIAGSSNGEIVVPFVLPDLGGQTITTANVLAALNAPTWQSWGNVDLYGVRYAASESVLLSDYAPFSDAAGNGTKIMDNFFVSGTGTAAYQDLETDSTGDAALAAWLTAQYDAGAQAGDYIFLRFQPDNMSGVGGHAITFATADTVAETTPVLTIELASSGVPDTDGDGLPDWWEDLYFGGPTNATPSDTAANGVNTVEETYIAGIDPTDPNAFFDVENLVVDSEFIFNWISVTDRVYSVYGTTNLIDGFQPVETNLFYPRNSWTGQIDGATFESFYQLKVELSP